jgi:hypothetical protein
LLCQREPVQHQNRSMDSNECTQGGQDHSKLLRICLRLSALLCSVVQYRYLRVLAGTLESRT